MLCDWWVCNSWWQNERLVFNLLIHYREITTEKERNIRLIFDGDHQSNWIGKDDDDVDEDDDYDDNDNWKLSSETDWQNE